MNTPVIREGVCHEAPRAQDAGSPRLSTALADAGPARLRDAAAWPRLRAEDGEVISTEIADAIVGDLTALVSSARRQNQSVYCWVHGSFARSQIATAAAVAVPRTTEPRLS